jgi:hypothetical protein
MIFELIPKGIGPALFRAVMIDGASTGDGIKKRADILPIDQTFLEGETTLNQADISIIK